MLKLNCHPYPCQVWFTNNPDEFNKHYRKLSGNNDFIDPEDNDGVTYSTPDYSKILIGVFTTEPGVLVHEIGHAVISICTRIRLDITDDTSEAFCYMLDSIYTQIHKHLDKLKLKEVK